MIKHRFTKAFLNNLEPPAKGRAYYHDDLESQFSVYITHKGSISFFTRKRVNGRNVRLPIGRYPDVTVEQARKKAQELKGIVASGKDPQKEKRDDERRNQTFGELFNEYMERYSKKHKKSWVYDKREMEKFTSHWFTRRISSIDKQEVQKLIEKVFANNGRYQANRLLERIRGIYNKGIEWGWKGTNPAVGIKKYKERSRDRFVLPHEMPHLINSIQIDENDTIRDFVLILLLTGARKTNTCMMRTDELVLDQSEWRIPDTKNGEPFIVNLVPRAVEIIEARIRMSNSYWIFPQDNDPEKHLVNPKRGWKRILCRATLSLWTQDEKVLPLLLQLEAHLGTPHPELKIKEVVQLAKELKVPIPRDMLDIRIHDLRRTFGSYQALSGASLQIIGKSLGHKSQQSTQVYARLHNDPIKASIEKATDAMFGIENTA